MPPAAKTSVARSVGSSIQVQTPGDLLALAEMLYRGGLCPPGIDNPSKVAAVILAGLEVGLAPTQALGSIMLTNGRLSIYGDGAMALVRASGLLESIEEWVEGEGEDRTGHCKGKRRGEPERHYTFSVRDANKAGLIERAKGKGPWVSYLDRMLIMRPRGFFFRDHFPDVLRGLIFWEEAQDIAANESQAVQATVVSATVDARPAASQVAPAALSAASSAASSPAPLATDAKRVTPEQLARIKEIRTAACVARSANDPATQKSVWSEILAGYGVASANEFTAEQADHFIAQEWPKNDPFGSPPTTASAT